VNGDAAFQMADVRFVSGVRILLLRSPAFVGGLLQFK
jgi:hypothetical protein